MNNVFLCSMEDLVGENQIRLSVRQKLYLKCKRGLDWVASLLIMTVLMPFFLGIAAAIEIEDPKGKVIFKQERVGQDGKIFILYKFRSMKSCAPERSTIEFLDADKYITRVGRFLRKTSLDELPQIWNVFCGTMSLIGPRPLIKNEQEVHFLRLYYGVYQIKPGITGLAQINGRDTMGNYDKVQWDCTYVRKLSFCLDVKILLQTVVKVLFGEGIVDDAGTKANLQTHSESFNEQEYQETQKDYKKFNV